MGSKKSFYTIPFVWSRSVWVITFSFFILWVGISAFMLYEVFALSEKTEPLIGLIVFNVIMLPTMLACEGLAPQRLEVGESQIVILRRYQSIVINRDEIKSVEQLPTNAMRGAIRTCGVGGLFGYYGKFYARSIGSFSLYATGSENLFLIRKWNGKNIVISCAEPDKMKGYL
uniref:PH domain-containing protein n=1 Tax=Alistipes sp. TaxID=1872444 RepID=UPI0040568A85